MYKRIVSSPIKGDLYSVQLYLLGANQQDRCRCLFPSITEDSFVVYIPNIGDITIVGYYSLDKQSITMSKYYESLIDNTIIITGEKNSSSFESMPCFHIIEWVFDESLKEKTRLESLFTILFASLQLEKDSIVWLDDGELIYYPIKKEDVVFGHNRAISFFTDRFSTK